MTQGFPSNDAATEAPLGRDDDTGHSENSLESKTCSKAYEEACLAFPEYRGLILKKEGGKSHERAPRQADHRNRGQEILRFLK